MYIQECFPVYSLSCLPILKKKKKKMQDDSLDVLNLIISLLEKSATIHSIRRCTTLSAL